VANWRLESRQNRQTRMLLCRNHGLDMRKECGRAGNPLILAFSPRWEKEPALGGYKRTAATNASGLIFSTEQVLRLGSGGEAKKTVINSD